jgi:hypothetical protein
MEVETPRLPKPNCMMFKYLCAAWMGRTNRCSIGRAYSNSRDTISRSPVPRSCPFRSCGNCRRGDLGKMCRPVGRRVDPLDPTLPRRIKAGVKWMPLHSLIVSCRTLPWLGTRVAVGKASLGIVLAIFVRVPRKDPHSLARAVR